MRLFARQRLRLATGTARHSRGAYHRHSRIPYRWISAIRTRDFQAHEAGRQTFLGFSNLRREMPELQRSSLH